MTRNGPYRWRILALRTANSTAQTAALPAMAGNARASKVLRNRLSRMVLDATCQAIISADARAASRARRLPGSDIGLVCYKSPGTGWTFRGEGRRRPARGRDAAKREFRPGKSCRSRRWISLADC